jgi:multidrug efflux pump subunit AcrA (membrane-fusion protein)
LLVVVVVVAAAMMALQNGQSVAPSQASVGGPTPAPTAAPAPLTAHGVVEPVLRARVGTQGGGVVRALSVAAGVKVEGQQELAVVQGPSGAEALTAPFAGTVTDVLVHLGDTVVPGAVIATVGDLSAYQVETTDVDQFLVAHVHPGQTVSATIDAISTRSMSGTVHTVAAEPQATSPGTKTYAVTVSLPGPPADLRPGMSARLTFTP